jgi:flagellar protein FlgJ
MTPAAHEAYETMKRIHLESMSPAQHPASAQQPLKRACEDFEAIFVQYLFKSMRQSVDRVTDDSEGSTRELHESMLDEAVAAELSRSGGLGLGKLLYEQLCARGTSTHHASQRSAQWAER